jgi:ABC-2 type transport system ATP-binding protein
VLPLRLTIENVTKEFRGHYAVRNFETELTEGVYGLIGPNGSGKTTLMRIMTDILKPTRGRILVNGQDIGILGDKYRDMLGYLPQDFGVYKNFCAKRFLLYIASLKGLDKNAAEHKVEETLKLVNLWDERDKKLGKFSGGMKRRLGIAQALLNDPKVLILDEPTAGLDPKERIRFRNIISEISGNRVVVLSTHIVSDIEFIAKEVILIKQGVLLRKDEPERILKELEDKVWTAVIPEHLLSEFQDKFRIGNIVRKPDGIEIRLIAEEKHLFDARLESPRLEDVYLYYFDERIEDYGNLKA